MRLFAAIRTDVTLQARNQLYAISVVVALLCAGALAWLTPTRHGAVVGLARTVPMALLLFVGGSTLLYVVAMILLERADGTLDAVCVSPLRPGEYLASKVASLTGLATMEGVAITVATTALVAPGSMPTLVGGASFVGGLVALGAMQVLVGVILVVRYDRIMQAMMPMSIVALILQLPAFYFVGVSSSPLLLVVPSAAPAMLVRGAFVPLAPWEVGYALLATTATLVALAVWARRAFDVHVVRRAG